ncbi:MAG: carbon monoxide dehydrogenase subunit G [Deltaproteobacteria bacterium]|nr:carbon monoxide dehydrogenase subunit G [Deltaproteobacteria bacterium]
MIIEGKLTVKAPIQDLWDMLLDPETLGSCLPGAEKVERIDEKTYDSVVKQKVGPIKVTIKFRNVLTEMQPPHRLVMEGEGEDITKLGHMKQKTIVELCDIGDGNVDVSYKSDVAIVGKLAMFGDRVMRGKAKEVEKEFTQNLQDKLNLTAS